MIENESEDSMDDDKPMEKNDDSAMEEIEEEINEVEVRGDAVLEEFVNLISKINNYKVTYDFTTEGIEFSQIQYVYNGEIRTDTKTQGLEDRVFILEEGIYTCTNMGSWICFEAPEQEEYVFNDGLEEVKANPDKFKEGVTKIEPRTIIGQATTCFNLVSEEFNYDYCLNSNGITLLISGTNGENQFDYIATDYSGDVSASDLTLPEEP